MRRHKDPSRRQPKHRRPPQPRQPPQARGHCTRYGALHPLRGGAPVTWRYTRTEEVHCLRIGCSAPTTRTNAELAHRTTHRRTPPCAAGPYWRQDGHAAHATTCTPAHSDTSHTLTCEEPDLDPNYTPNYEEPLFVKAVGHSRQRRWRRPTRMMETSSCWDRIPILLRSGGVFGPAKARSWIG